MIYSISKFNTISSFTIGVTRAAKFTAQVVTKTASAATHALSSVTNYLTDRLNFYEAATLVNSIMLLDGVYTLYNHQAYIQELKSLGLNFRATREQEITNTGENIIMFLTLATSVSLTFAALERWPEPNRLLD